ncbi:MAG: SpoIIE family protein phosphatase [Candidatus Sumerlaeaceae bacterium]|nr:SpoIIE family protein phosphatase [Candidatus Sumerlaeaceae bacterium]
MALIYLVIIGILAFWVASLKRREQQLLQLIEKYHRERKATFAFLNNLGERLTTSNIALEPTLEIITEFIMDATEAEAGAAFLVDRSDNTVSARIVQGMFPPLMPTTNYVLTKQKYLEERLKREKIPLGQGLIGEVAQSGLPALVADAENDPRVPQPPKDFPRIRSIMAAPLVARGQISGVLVVVNKRGGGTFSQEDYDLLVALADQAASTVEFVKLHDEFVKKQRIEQELQVAHEFQRMLLPEKCPHVPGYRIAAFSKPALEVGGDYYDFFFVDDERRYLGIVIADVSGKGIPGGLIMAMVRAVLRAEARGNLSPRDVLLRTNERTYEDTKDNVFVTMIYGILDTKERLFRFARAGHEPVVVVNKQTQRVRLHSPEGIALGMVENDIFASTEEKTIRLEAGDIVTLYTDGVVEARDEAKNEYGQQRFLDFLVANREASPGEILNKVLSDIESFTRGIPQHDDITLVAFEVLEVADEVNQPNDCEKESHLIARAGNERG